MKARRTWAYSLRTGALVVLSLAALALPTRRAAAQGVTTGAITGVVSDAEGKPVAGAQVVIRSRATGFQTGTLSRATGLYLVQGLEVGQYTVRVEMIGYANQQVDNVTVALSSATRVNFKLTQQAVQLQGLEVSVERNPKFSPTTQGVSTTIGDTLVHRIPTLSRDFVDLVKLSPQVTFAAGGAASGAGAYNRFNTITIDGANNSERFNLGSTGGVPGGSAGGKIIALDAVKEFKVMFTPTDVRQGNFAGMLVNAVTKSGTNDLHGSALFTYRSNADVLGLNLVGSDLRPAEFKVKQYGFTLGGPIIKDKLHFFLAPELQDRANPATGPYVDNNTIAGGGSIPADSLKLIASTVQSKYGVDVGSMGAVSNTNPLKNLFGRVDYEISEHHRLAVREIYNTADQDNFSRNNNSYQTSPLNQNAGFRFRSNGYTFSTKNSSTVAQLYSNFSSGASNELLAGYSYIDARRKTPVSMPEVGVGVNVGGTVRAVTFGTEQFSPNNILTQKITEVVNNFTYPMGAHTFTMGGRLDLTHIYNNFAQGIYGVYNFPTIAALTAGTPNGYAVGYPNSGNPGDIPADFNVRVYSIYGQDQWAITPRLTLTAGLRGDMPQFPTKPSFNQSLYNQLVSAGMPNAPRTDAVPGTRMMLSPRIGFNFDPTGDQKNQIRGGIGIYTGPPPYILIGNEYANTGLGLVRLSCTGTGTPAFVTDVNTLPKSCAGQPAPVNGAAGTVGINTTDPNFKFPQFFGISGGFDRQLPYNVVFTLEGLYRKAINGVLVRDLNIKGPRMLGGQVYRDVNGRVMYADTISATGSVTNVNQRWITTVNNVAFNEGIIDVTNESKDYNYSISGQLGRRFSDVLDLNFAYTYMQSKDVQSLTSDRAISNWRFGRQVGATGHEDLNVTSSNFERPHRILAYGTYTLPWKITELTAYYEGTSGVKFDYVTSGDVNGDLTSGNDMIYIPNNATDANEIHIGTGVGAAFVQNVDAAKAFNDFISSQPCLDKQRGHIMARNSCNTPFQHRLDLSLRQAVPQIHGQQLSLQLDFFNFLNFLNKDWGQVKLPTLSPFNNNQSALIQTGRGPGPLSTSLVTYTFDNRLYQSAKTDKDGNPRSDYLTPLPFQGRSGSVYNIQLTLRYAF